VSEREVDPPPVELPTGGLQARSGPDSGPGLGDTARRAAIWGLVLLGIAALALALWKLRLLVGLLFLAVVVAAAIRPSVDALARRRVPRIVGVAVHYLALATLFALFVWLVVPRALNQIENALGVSGLPTSAGDLSQAANNSTGVKHDLLVALQKRLQHLPSASKLVRPGLQVGLKAFEVLIGVFFVFASAAYWIFERDRAVSLVASLLPRPKRKVVHDTWTLIDLKLGAFVRGQLLLIAFVAVVLSLAFWAIGEPYWILVGSFAGIVEIIPIIGPLAAGALAVGAGLTDSVRVAVEAGLAVLGMRLLEDYLVMPRVLGDAVGLTPLVVLVSVTSVGILFGGFAIILAIPLAAVASTLIDVIVRNRDPAEEDVPKVLFSASDSET
jgi:predicted PurR-regulated permease PerM